jgi:hypothetical protein
MVSAVLAILLGPFALLWAIFVATTGVDPGTQTLFTIALAGGFGTVIYAVVCGAIASLVR